MYPSGWGHCIHTKGMSSVVSDAVSRHSVLYCIYLTAAKAFAFFTYQNMKIYILHAEELPLRHQFDGVITAKSGLGLPINILMSDIQASH